MSLLSCAPTNIVEGDVELQGKVLFDGKPFANDSVQFIFNNNKISKKVCSDSMGLFQIKIPRGKYTIKQIITNNGGLVTETNYGKAKYDVIYQNMFEDINNRKLVEGKYILKPIYLCTRFKLLKPPQGKRVNDTLIYFAWQKYLDINNYELYVMANNQVCFNSGVIQDTTCCLPVKSNKKGGINQYKWYIVAYSQSRDIVAFSEESSFSTNYDVADNKYVK